jgi:DNA-binding XRE family transcriptional regulator
MNTNKLSLVKKACKELNITQKELAKRIGVNERTISVWNRGEMEKSNEVLLNALIHEHRYFTIVDLISENNLINRD